MQDKYRVNYKKDIRIAKKKRFIAFIATSVTVVVLLMCAVYFLFTKLQNTKSNDFAAFEGKQTDIKNTDDEKNKKNIADTGNKNNIIDNNNNDNTDNGSHNSDAFDGANGSDGDNYSDVDNSADDGLKEIKESEKEYIYGEKVPENEAVADEYFDDAVFIGNSQIEGISIYSSMKDASVFAGKGIMVDTIFTKEIVKTQNGSRITIMDALAEKQFEKVYIMLGANELGWAFDYLFIEQYGKVIDEIKKLQPNAKIYVNAIMPVSKEKSAGDKIYNNNNIDNYNNLILNMTKEKEVYFIDSKEALADEEGNLPEDSGTDGVHFNSTYYEKWFNYLKTHTVD